MSEGEITQLTHTSLDEDANNLLLVLDGLAAEIQELRESYIAEMSKMLSLRSMGLDRWRGTVAPLVATVKSVKSIKDNPEAVIERKS